MPDHEPAAPPPTAPFNVDEYHTNVPAIRPQELRIIGRCVSFLADAVRAGQPRTYAFKGWVAHITKDTVTLLDVIRFDTTEELQRSALDLVAEAQQFPLTLHRVAHQYSPIIQCSRDLVSSPGGAIPYEGTFGRIPYATFLRRKIRNVKFETDMLLTNSQRSINDAFAKPEASGPWYHHDVQKVRMFVRRYLVHTSQRNNTQELSLVSFLQQRFHWETVNRPLLQDVVREEVDELKQLDDEIMNRNANRDDTRRAQGGGGNRPQHGVAATTAARLRMVGTGIPTKTSYIAILFFALAVGILLYTASVYTTTDKVFLFDFLRNALLYAALGGGALICAGVSTGISSLRMSFPVAPRHVVLRVLISGAAGILLAYSLYLNFNAMVKYQDASGSSLINLYKDKVESNPSGVCQFFLQNSCSGYTTPCGSSTTSECPSCSSTPNRSCGEVLQSKVRNGVIALVCLEVAACVFLLTDWVLAFKAVVAR